MDTVRWTCDECETVNVVVLKEDDESTELTCRACGGLATLSLVRAVLVVNPPEPVHHTGGA